MFEVGDSFAQALEERHPCLGCVNFHSAVIDNQLTNAGLNPHLTETERWACEEFADYVLAVAASLFKSKPSVVSELRAAMEYSKEFYSIFGTPTARERLYKRGVTKFY